MKILLFLYLTAGLVLAVLSLPLIAGRVKPNPFYGFRIRATLEDPQLWVSVNRYFGKLQLVVALVVIFGSLGFYFLPGLSVDAYALSVLALFTVALAVALVRSWLYMRSLR